MALSFRNRAASTWLLSLVATAAVGLTGCAPSWMTRTQKLVDAEDFDGAYAVAAEAQQANTSPMNTMAALMAGVAAFRGDRLQLAEEHLRFASSTEASNPAWVQFRAWEMTAFVKLRIASEQMSGQRDAADNGSPDALSAYYRRASATMADADAALTMAIDLATGAGDKESAEKFRVERAGMRRIRDNLNAMSELPDLARAIKEGGSSAETALLNVMMIRIEAIGAAIEDLCDECDAKKRKAAKEKGEDEGKSGQEPAASKPVS